jgi:hypothetical protein
MSLVEVVMLLSPPLMPLLLLLLSLRGRPVCLFGVPVSEV